MVQALLSGRKSQTRRVAKLNAAGRLQRGGRNWHVSDPEAVLACPYGDVTHELWVRETWGLAYYESRGENEPITFYRATPDTNSLPAVCKWRPSIFMPRKYSRITLRITGVRVERLQDISEDDAIAEGIDGPLCVELTTKSPWKGVCAPVAIHAYAALWERINGVGSWNASPWVWAISFERINNDAKAVT